MSIRQCDLLRMLQYLTGDGGSRILAAHHGSNARLKQAGIVLEGVMISELNTIRSSEPNDALSARTEPPAGNWCAACEAPTSSAFDNRQLFRSQLCCCRLETPSILCSHPHALSYASAILQVFA